VVAVIPKLRNSTSEYLLLEGTTKPASPFANKAKFEEKPV